MRRSPALALWSLLLYAPALSGQVLDETLVPRGYLRLQAHPHFTAWDTRYGRLPDGTESEEKLGDDLTDPTSLSLFPGISTVASVVRDLTGAGYTPVLGSTSGLVRQDVTQIDFGAHVGVFDWLTIGAVLPWVQTRTTVETFFAPDTLTGNLGLNPLIADQPGVEGLLASTQAADLSAQGNAATACAGGPGPACSAAQALADRASAFNSSLASAYSASPFFPIVGSVAATDLAQVAATLDADLTAAGLVGIAAPMVFASEFLTEEGFGLLPTVLGAGIEARQFLNRKDLWAAGDLEVSARVRLLDNTTPNEDGSLGGFRYRLTASGLARLGTGLREDPDVLLDLGTGDGQMDYEGGLTAVLWLGSRLALAAGGRYGVQGSTTVTKRVTRPELVLQPLDTRTFLTWQPGDYVHFQAAPSFRFTSELSVTAEYRFFHKRRDEFELVTPLSGLNPVVLEIESGIKAHQFGGGIRYDTRAPRGGVATRPVELHLRLLSTVGGSGGQVPKTTRVEAGIRLFRRFWGQPR